MEMEKHSSFSALDAFFITASSLIGNFLLNPVVNISTELDISKWEWVLYGVILILMAISGSLIGWASTGGPAWGASKGFRNSIPGPRGWPIIGSLLHMQTSQPHRHLAILAARHNALELMSFSLGHTRVIIASQPHIAKEILSSSSFVDRPLKESARLLQFGRAIGFAPYGDYWRNLRRIAAHHLFSPKQIVAVEPCRRCETTLMLNDISLAVSTPGCSHVVIREFLRKAALNNVMMAVFGHRYDLETQCPQAQELQSVVREGFEVLGAFNMADHLPLLKQFDPQRIHKRCVALVPRVNKLVQDIIRQHRDGILKKNHEKLEKEEEPATAFVDVLLNLEGDDKLQETDMIAILWEMIFRGTDTVAILTEWVLAELILNRQVQVKLRIEIDTVMMGKKKGEEMGDVDISRMPYLQCVLKETLRKHPPGPLLSWARLATHDTFVAGHMVPSGTSAMVNMWAITHDPAIWTDPCSFLPERFFDAEVDIRGGDLRLAPFGAGRRVCPGLRLGLATVSLWVASLVHRFEWGAYPHVPVNLTEVLKLSSEMLTPLHACPVDRNRTQ